jgi:hypothetical protein
MICPILVTLPFDKKIYVIHELQAITSEIHMLIFQLPLCSGNLSQQ